MELLRALETIRSPFFDLLIGLITRLGEETIIMVAICAVYWCINKRVAYGIGIAFFFSGLTVQGMKICFRIERPWVADPTLNPVPMAMEQATGYSFPSGHTQSAASFFGSLGAALKQKPLKITCIVIIALVGFSRLYLGVHRLIDVIVSILISLALVAFTVLFFKNDKVDRKKEFILSLVMSLYSITVIIIAAVLYSGGVLEQGYVSDCLKAAGAGIGFAVGMYVERVHIDFSVSCKSCFMQILKLVIGLIGIIIIKEGLKVVAGTGLVIDSVRYFLMPIWLTVAYPQIIKRFFVTISS